MNLLEDWPFLVCCALTAGSILFAWRASGAVGRENKRHAAELVDMGAIVGANAKELSTTRRRAHEVERALRELLEVSFDLSAGANTAYVEAYRQAYIHLQRWRQYDETGKVPAAID